MVFYDFIGILIDFLPANYYNHILCYVLFLRLLSKTKIEDNDIQDANDLIHYFNKNFEKLYGIESVTFNLHAHLHLPNQVKLYGPLIKSSHVFQFEGMFKFMKDQLNGTRGLVKQISKGIEISQYLNFHGKDKIQRSENLLLREFIENEILKNNTTENESSLIDGNFKIKEFDSFEKSLFLKFGFKLDDHVSSCNILKFNSRGNYKIEINF